MAWEGEMFVSFSGELQVNYFQDNRLGNNVDHDKIKKAVDTLPKAFADRVGGKKIVLTCGLVGPFILFGLLIVVGAIVITTVVNAPVESAPEKKCPEMGEPGWFECKSEKSESEHNKTGGNMGKGFGILAGCGFAWFIASAGLMCFRSSAIKEGMSAVQEQIGRLNSEMYPFNFSYRTEVIVTRSHGVHDGPGHGKTHSFTRYFLNITNLANQSHGDADSSKADVVIAQVVGVV